MMITTKSQESGKHRCLPGGGEPQEGLSASTRLLSHAPSPEGTRLLSPQSQSCPSNTRQEDPRVERSPGGVAPGHHAGQGDLPENVF